MLIQTYAHASLSRWFAGRDGRYGSEGQLRRRRGTEQARYPDAQVPDRARHRHQLGRHGEDLASHVLQRAACRSRGAPGPVDRGAAEPQGQPREDDTGSSVVTFPARTQNINDL